MYLRVYIQTTQSQRDIGFYQKKLKAPTLISMEIADEGDNHLTWRSLIISRKAISNHVIKHKG